MSAMYLMMIFDASVFPAPLSPGMEGGRERVKEGERERKKERERERDERG